MATLTTNISNVSLTVSGKNTQTATISWTCPTVPAGMTITSCRLTGNTSSFTTGNKGATLTINNTSVSSGSSFTINLGTGNNTTSVQASFVGAHKQTNTSVTLSNLVYTVEYTEPLPIYIVTFKDWDGSVLKTEEVESGSAATAPSNPSREGYEFAGWDNTFSNIMSDLTVTAQYNIKTYTVKFYSDTTLIKTETVEHGKSVIAPNSPTKKGYTFIGWDKDFNNVTSDLNIYAQYEINKYIVTFVDYDGTILKTEEVEYGSSATAPEVSREGYELTGWSIDFTNITSDIITVAQYVVVGGLKIKENGDWINISKVYKRVSGNWIEQDNSNWDELFNSNSYYLRVSAPMAALYNNGILIFTQEHKINNSSEDIVETYTGWETDLYEYSQNRPWYSQKDNISKIIINYGKPISLRTWFSSMPSLTEIDFTGLDTSNVTTMRYAFSSSSALTSLDLSNFNTSNVTDMEQIFKGCSSLTFLDLSSFNTSNVTNMSNMFDHCSNLTSLDLSNFDTSSVTSITYMFDHCSNLTSLDLSNFDTSGVTRMVGIFRYCSSLAFLDLSNFDTGKVTTMDSMFFGCSSLTSLNVSNFDTSNVTDMDYMFQGCSALTSLNLSSFDMTNVTSTNNMFQGCTSLQTIYVKNETAKTKIEASTNFPTGISVIIGKPN